MTDHIHTLTHIRTYRSDILLPGAYFEMRSSPGGILGMGLCLLVVWPVKQYPIICHNESPGLLLAAISDLATLQVIPSVGFTPQLE